MAAAFWVASIGFASILTWMLSPIISFFLNKFLSYIYDASIELIDLRSGTMETLTLTLRGVQEERMLIELGRREAERPQIGEIATTLDKLKDALYNAEDIYDLIEYYQLEKKAGESDDTTWLQWCWLRLYASIRESSAWMLQLVKKISEMLWHMARDISAPLLHQVLQWPWVCVALEKSAWLLQWLQEHWMCFYGIIRECPAVVLQMAKEVLLWLWRHMCTSDEHNEQDEQREHLLPVTRISAASSWMERLSSWFRNLWTSIIKKCKDATLIRNQYCDAYFLENYRQTINKESNSPVMVPLYKILKENNKHIKKLIASAGETVSSRNIILESIAQAYQPRESGRAEQNFMAEDTSSTPFLRERVVGRDQDRKKITDMLRRTEDGSSGSSSDTCFSVIGIVGIPGSGKTTLAQYVYEYEVTEKYFEFIMWVHVSQSFRVDVIYKEMSAHDSKEYIGNMRFETLEGELRMKLSEKRFLLVLDDIWYSNEELPRLISVLKIGQSGSKILVTSRHADILSKLNADVRHTAMQISDLDDESFLELFMYLAVGAKSTRGADNEKVRVIGNQIAKKLKKSPLLASIVGGTLRAKPGSEVLVSNWTNVLNQELLDDPKRILWWCYTHLDEQIKQCFTFCSIFPRRYRMYRDELVNLWVAQGFINTTNDGQEMENVGRGYFDKLVSTSFLKSGGKDPSGKDYYLIHDLLHDVAEKIAGSDCHNIVKGSTKEVPLNVRHLCIELCDAAMLKKDIFKLEKLRTLIIYEGAEDITEEVLEEMFNRLNKLRVLIFQTERNIGNHDCAILSFPESIGCLRHLRYLGFQILRVPSVTLPGRLAKLYFMEVLDLGHDGHFKLSSVTDMKNVINLRHLMSDWALDCPNIGTLTSLQTIPEFDLRIKGSELQHLKHLNKLQGKLEISGLGHARTREEALEANLADISGLGHAGTREEALEANLADKEGLTELALRWDDGFDWDRATTPELEVQADVLECLCPPIYVEKLSIYNYNGSRYPDWMHRVGAQGSRISLHELELDCCARPAPQLLFIPVISLVLRYCYWDTLPYIMEGLSVLVLDNCELPASIEDLTSLEKLSIRSHDDIEILPALPRSLHYIELRGYNEMKMAAENWTKFQDISHKYLDDWLLYEEDSGRGSAQSFTGATISTGDYECGWEVRKRQHDRKYRGPE